MKKLITLLSLAILVMGGIAQAQDARPAYETGHLYLKLHNHLSLELPQFTAATGVVELKSHTNPAVAQMGALLESYGAYTFRKPFRTHSPELDRTYEVFFADADNATPRLLRELGQNTLLEYVEQVPVMYLDETNFTPNDYNAAQQWFLGAINAPTAWDISKGSDNVVIAIIDDQVQTNHPDLAANIWVNPGEIAGNNVDDDGNGRVDDINGWDVADNDNDVFTETFLLASHGTHTAGCASAVSDNGTGLSSIGFSCKIMVCKSTSDGNTNNPPTINNGWGGVDYAIDNGADVISMSWGGTGFSQTNQNLINAGWNQGIILVSSAGNGDTDGIGDDHDVAANKRYPCDYDNIVCVGATTSASQKTSFSDYGGTIDLMAPGDNIRSTYCSPLSSYAFEDGTSMSTPIVSGMFGLMKSANPCLTNVQLLQYAKQTATAINNPLFTQGKLGAGIINAGAALQAIEVNVVPDPQFTFAPQSACSDKVAFTYTDPGGLQACPAFFDWSVTDVNGNTVAVSNDQNPVFTLPTGTADYTVTLFVQNNAGTNSVTQTVTINNGSGIFVNTPGTLSACSGIPISSGTTSTVPPASILWQPATGLSNAGTLNPTITATANTTYIVTMQANGCTVKDTLVVTVKSAPLTNIIQPTTQATYNSSAPSAAVTLKANGATSYLWSPASDLNQTTGATVTATPWLTTTYKVTGSYANGCAKTDSITIIVPVTGTDAAAIAGINALAPNPAGDHVTLSATFVQEAQVAVSLSDLTGRVITTLYEGKVQPGDFSQELDLRKVSTGVYLVTWVMNGATWHQKLQVH